MEEDLNRPMTTSSDGSQKHGLKKYNMKLTKICTIIALIFCLHISSYQPAQAQCPMCKMTAESNLKGGGSAGKGLNAGILYMLLTPYVLIGTVAFVWYRNKRKEEDIIED